ncbi:MAG: amphi-Trp domain-containing protein [Deltaproteobacteria bacterium]|jgi:amphi-Trp domain-containing protein|nr:amphi-Trp domain-containing protein [Deltaproteobacteria bacterium]
MNSNNFHYNFVTDPQDVVRYLEALIEGFKGGALDFSSPGHAVHLELPEILKMSIETSNRKGRVKVSLNLTWPENPKDPLLKDPKSGFGLSKS